MSVILRPEKDAAKVMDTHNYMSVMKDDEDTFVYSWSWSGVLKTDVYECEDYDEPYPDNLSVTVKAKCKAENLSSSAKVKLGLRIGSTIYYAPEESLSTAWEWYEYTWSSNPSGGDWTVSGVNSADIAVGIKPYSSNNAGYCCEAQKVVDSSGGNGDGYYGDSSSSSSSTSSIPESWGYKTRTCTNGTRNRRAANYTNPQ